MTAPQMVGSIIGIEWLARQMGLSVDVVRERIEQAREEDVCTSTLDRRSYVPQSSST